MLELLCPAGSMEALVAAVENGADAVYLGAGDFNARRNAKNFQLDQLQEAVSYCHLRGVQLHLTLNTLVNDRQCPQVVDTIRTAAEAGVDAFIVQNWGILEICRQVAPWVDCHGSTQMSVHNLEGVRQAAALGCSRVVLARELAREDYLEICGKSPIEIEVFGHGALCMCHSGQCYFSALVGRRSGNRGQCAQPCRLPYGYGKFQQKYPMSLKDSCLISYVSDLEAMGVASLKLEGRMKRPEYVAIVTRIYRKAFDGIQIEQKDLQLLETVFSREGFTSGYFDRKLGKEMFGTRQDERLDESVLADARATYEKGNRPCVGLDFQVKIARGQSMTVSASDGQFPSILVTGEVPQEARNRPLTVESVVERFGKLGGTPFYVNSCQVNLDEGLMVAASSLNQLRRDALELISKQRTLVNTCNFGEYSDNLQENIQSVKPAVTVSVTSWEQVTEELMGLKPAMIYVPIHILCQSPVDNYSQKDKLCGILPRVILSRDRLEVVRQLETLQKMGISHLLGGNIGHLELAEGFTLHGDFGLNCFNSASGLALKAMGFQSVTASFELLLAQIRDLKKALPTEVLVYGRLPLMITENCLISWEKGKCNCENSVELVDRKGEAFPLLRDGASCRTVVYNGKILYLLDRLEALEGLGLWAVRLAFSTECPREVDKIVAEYREGGSFDGNLHTKGLYFRGVT